MTDNQNKDEQPRPDSPTTMSAAAARAEFDQAVADLFGRLEPSTIAHYAKEDSKQAVSDAVTALSGGGLPDASPRRKRNAIAILSASAISAAFIGMKILRRK